jgi:hypothetical protein
LTDPEIVSGKGIITVGRAGGVVGFGHGPYASGTSRVVLRLDMPTLRKRGRRSLCLLSLSGRPIIIRFGVGSFVARFELQGGNAKYTMMR